MRKPAAHNALLALALLATRAFGAAQAECRDVLLGEAGESLMADRPYCASSLAHSQASPQTHSRSIPGASLRGEASIPGGPPAMPAPLPHAQPSGALQAPIGSPHGPPPPAPPPSISVGGPMKDALERIARRWGYALDWKVDETQGRYALQYEVQISGSDLRQDIKTFLDATKSEYIVLSIGIYKANRVVAAAAREDE